MSASAVSRKQPARARQVVRRHLSRAVAIALATTVVVIAALVAHGFGGNAAQASARSTEAASSQPQGSMGFGTIAANGHVYQTLDGGAHWSPVSLPADASDDSSPALTYGISASTRWVAWSAADGATSAVTVERTTDNGVTWHSVMLPALAQPEARPRDMRFIDQSHGWLVIDESPGRFSVGALFMTSDGGSTWSEAALPFAGSIYFASPSIGWLVGGQWATTQNLLEITRDGGKTWTQQAIQTPAAAQGFEPIIGVPHFFDAQNGVLPVNFGPVAGLLITHDAGRSWSQAATFTLSAGDQMAEPLVATSGRGAWVIIGHSLLVTQDSGQTWGTLSHSQSLIGVVALSFVSSTTGWALTENGSCASFKSHCSTVTSLVRTIDGGSNWATVSGVNF